MKKLFNHVRWYVMKEWRAYLVMFILLIGIALFALIPGWLF
jgi:hypothetical protein